MEVEGIITNILPPVTGTSARGQWSRQDVIIEQPSEFNKKLCVSFWGDKANELSKFSIGTKVSVGINIESREYNGRWYTEVRAWKIASAMQQAPLAQEPFTADAPFAADAPDLSNYSSAPQEDDLPF